MFYKFKNTLKDIVFHNLEIIKYNMEHFFEIPKLSLRDASCRSKKSGASVFLLKNSLKGINLTSH